MQEELSPVYVVVTKTGDKLNSWLKLPGLCEWSLCSLSLLSFQALSAIWQVVKAPQTVWTPERAEGLETCSLVSDCLVQQHTHTKNDAFVLYWAAWFAVTFNFRLDPAACLITQNALGRQGCNGQAMPQLQGIDVWGLSYIQMKWLFLFISCLNIVQIMEYLVEQSKLLLASILIPVVTQWLCIYNLTICSRVEFRGRLGVFFLECLWKTSKHLFWDEGKAWLAVISKEFKGTV